MKFLAVLLLLVVVPTAILTVVAARAVGARELVLRKGFTAVAVEADWPDAARIDAYVRHRPPSPPGDSRAARR